MIRQSSYIMSKWYVLAEKLENWSEDSEEEGEGWISWGAGQQQQKTCRILNCLGRE